MPVLNSVDTVASKQRNRVLPGLGPQMHRDRTIDIAKFFQVRVQGAQPTRNCDRDLPGFFQESNS